MKYLGILLLLVGCASFDYYHWEKINPPVEFRFWTQVNRMQDAPFTCPTENQVACTRVMLNMCETYSIYGKEEAKHHGDPDGLSIYDHETKHCDGWAHQ